MKRTAPEPSFFSSFFSSKQAKVKMFRVSIGDRIQVCWEDGKYYTAWVTSLKKKGDDELIAGVYYEDKSFEEMNLVEVNWKPYS